MMLSAVEDVAVSYVVHRSYGRRSRCLQRKADADVPREGEWVVTFVSCVPHTIAQLFD